MSCQDITKIATFGELISRSGCSEIYAKQNIVVKIMSRDSPNRDNIDNEIKILRMLDHENVIKLLEVKNLDKNVYLSFNRAQYDLHKVIYYSEYTGDNIEICWSDIIQAVLYCHSMGVVHNDIKPKNILVDNGILKLCDFGFSKTDFYGRSGSPVYMSPRKLIFSESDFASDIWSCGATLYEMIYKKRLFDTNDYEYLIILAEKCEISYEESDLMTTFLQKTLKKILVKDLKLTESLIEEIRL